MPPKRNPFSDNTPTKRNLQSLFVDGKLKGIEKLTNARSDYFKDFSHIAAKPFGDKFRKYAKTYTQGLLFLTIMPSTT